MITKPVLPPKKGYVEVINEQGEHVYQATPRQQLINDLKDKIANIDVACIPETEEGAETDTTDIIINKLDYIAELLNSILELL